MRKRVFGRKLKRDKNQRKALFRGLMNSLVLEGKIKTTDAKAKSIRAEVEKLVTRARNNGEDAKRIIVGRLGGNVIAAEKMISEIGPKFAGRSGGYTRILKLGPRVKDGAEIVLMSWVEEVSKTIVKEDKKKTLKKNIKTSSKKEEKKAEKPLVKKSAKK